MQTIGDVLSELRRTIRIMQEQQNPMGYFAALYLGVTERVAAQLQPGGVFDQPEQIEQLDLRFAARYFTAVDHAFTGTPATGPWQLTIEAARQKGIFIDQHFIAAANAHINFDLAIAVGELFRGRDMTAFRKDFDALNTLLYSMNGTVNGMIVQIVPIMRYALMLFGGWMKRYEDSTMHAAREQAWNYAVQLAGSDEPGRAAIMKEMEQQAETVGRNLLFPGVLKRFFFRCMSWMERGTVAQKISILTNHEL